MAVTSPNPFLSHNSRSHLQIMTKFYTNVYWHKVMLTDMLYLKIFHRWKLTVEWLVEANNSNVIILFVGQTISLVFHNITVKTNNLLLMHTDQGPMNEVMPKLVKALILREYWFQQDW